MKIVDIQLKNTSFKRRKVFKIAFTESLYAKGIYVKITTDSGICGLGEAVPMAFVTGETAGSVAAAIELMKPALLGADPADPEQIHAIMDRLLLNNTSAKAAIDIACYDIIGKSRGMAVHRLLGAQENQIVTDMTIGIDTEEKMVEDALGRVAQGFRVLKVKGGISPREDISHLRAIRTAVGDAAELRVDFNQGYDFDTALSVLRQLPELGITEVEQPLIAWDMDGMAALKRCSPVPLMIDEGVHLPWQAVQACEKDACDIVNIKLMKCGGIYPAMQIADIARRYGKPCMVGCMSESKLGIAAGAAVVAANRDLMGVVDLDSFMSFLDGEGGVTGGFTVTGDVLTLSEQPAFGFDEYEF